MRKLAAFNFISLNGMYKGDGDDISWHRHGGEEAQFSVDSLEADNILLLGRVTYEMFASWWPTPMAAEAYPAVASMMNSAEKIVFSNVIEEPRWHNTKAMSGDIVAQVRDMKAQPGKDMTILGSGAIVSQFAEAGLIDEFQIMIDPVVVSGGIGIFSHMQQSLALELTGTKVFKSGSILLTYRPE